jgi:hypothetical protein
MYHKCDIKPRSFSATKKNDMLQSNLQLTSTKKSANDLTSNLSKSQNATMPRNNLDVKKIKLNTTLGKINEENEGTGYLYNFDKNFFDEKEVKPSTKYDLLNKTKKIINNKKLSTSTGKGTTIIINNNININTYVTKQCYYDHYNRPESTTSKLYDRYLSKEGVKVDQFSKKKIKFSNDNLFGSSNDYKFDKVDYKPYDRTRKNVPCYQPSERKLSGSSNNLTYKYDTYTSLYKKYQNNPGFNNFY